MHDARTERRLIERERRAGAIDPQLRLDTRHEMFPGSGFVDGERCVHPTRLSPPTPFADPSLGLDVSRGKVEPTRAQLHLLRLQQDQRPRASSSASIDDMAFEMDEQQVRGAGLL